MHIESLTIHPIKSCAPLNVDEVSIDARGLVDDRRWMVVDEHGDFVTQREAPTMARVLVRPAGTGWRVSAGETTCVVEAPDAEARLDVTVWGDRVRARVHAEGSRFFSDALGRAVRLVHFGPEAERAAGSRAPGAKVGFADGYPVLVTTTASLADLNGRLAQPVPMSRFRPNVVVAGAAPFAEDDWDRFRFGEIAARMVKRCERCSIVTVDDGVKTKEPLATLSTYRRSGGAGVFFGVNVVAEPGRLRVGDPVVLQDS
ncbi:MAG: MOSC domain-containing protein [Sandaracinus sp.]|nr:MOSC domain-containing protein [Sandaracinus sp.]